MDSIYTITNNLRNLNIDISRIKATNNERIDTQTYGGYTIYFGGFYTQTKKATDDTDNNKNNNIKPKIPYNSVVAISIKNNLTKYINNIYRINGK